MKAEKVGGHVYVALALAAIAAVLSGAHGGMAQDIKSLLVANIGTEMSGLAEAIGGDLAQSVPP